MVKVQKFVCLRLCYWFLVLIDMFCVLCQALPFAAFQRLTDVYWIHPFLYKKDAYLSASDLNDEMWSCIRRDKKLDGKTEKKATVMDKVKCIAVYIYIRLTKV